MKDKSPLTLMELLLMLLVFALAAALCLQAFAAAGRISRESERRDKAVTEVQSMAEVLCSCRGDMARAAALWGGDSGGGRWTLERGGLRLEAQRMDSAVPLLGRAEVRAVDSAGAVIFALNAAWQEEAEHG